MTSETYNLIRFPKLNLQFDVDSVAFEIGGYEIAWYGVIITFGMILAMIFGFSKMKKFGVDPDKGIDCVIAGIFGGIIGARLYYVIMEIDQYKSFKDVIDISQVPSVETEGKGENVLPSVVTVIFSPQEDTSSHISRSAQGVRWSCKERLGGTGSKNTGQVNSLPQF